MLKGVLLLDNQRLSAFLTTFHILGNIFVYSLNVLTCGTSALSDQFQEEKGKAHESGDSESGDHLFLIDRFNELGGFLFPVF